MVMAIILAGGGAIAWRKIIRDQVIPKNFGVVEPGKLYRSGGLTESTMRDVVKEHHIRTIVDLGAFDHEPQREASMQALADELMVNRHTFRLKGDGTGNPNDYVAALRYMTNRDNQPVLVMCSAGAQRTGAAVILYRCIQDGQTIQQAYPESFQHRHDPGHDWTMITYLADWADEIQQAYRDGEWVASQPPAAELYQAKPATVASGEPSLGHEAGSALPVNDPAPPAP
jgi:hypothetical protein